jgi:hypothetical protein
MMALSRMTHSVDAATQEAALAKLEENSRLSGPRPRVFVLTRSD